MSESTLPLALVGMNANPAVVAELLLLTTFPSERPSYWAKSPNIAAPLPTNEAVAFARKSVMHALTIAEGSGTTAQTLAKLARFSQLTVRRAVARHPNLDPDTVRFLTNWAVAKKDSDTIRRLAEHQDPRIWIPQFHAAGGRNVASQAEHVGLYVAESTDPQHALAVYAALPGLDPTGKSIELLVQPVTKILMRGQDNRVLDPVDLLNALPDRTARAIVAALALPRYWGDRLSDAYVETLVGDLSWSQDTTLPAVAKVWTNAGVGRMSDHAARKLLGIGQPVVSELLLPSLAYGVDSWERGTVNAVVQAFPDEFISHYLCGRVRYPKLVECLDDETVRVLVRKADPRRVTLADDPMFAGRALGLPDPVDAAAAMLLLDPNAVNSALCVAHVQPSVSPSDLLDFVDRVTRSALAPGNCEILEGNRVWRDRENGVHVHARYVPPALPGDLLYSLLDFWFSQYTPSAAPTAWVMELLDLVGAQTVRRALGRDRDPTVIDVWTYAFHAHLDAVLHEVPAAWPVALHLAADWTGSVTDLALTSLDAVGWVPPVPQPAAVAETEAVIAEPLVGVPDPASDAQPDCQDAPQTSHLPAAATESAQPDVVIPESTQACPELDFDQVATNVSPMMEYTLF